MTVAVLDDRLGLVGVSGEFFSGHAISLRPPGRGWSTCCFAVIAMITSSISRRLRRLRRADMAPVAAIAMAELGAGERVMDRALIRLYRLRGMLTE